MNTFFRKAAAMGLGKEAVDLHALGQFAASRGGHALLGAGLGAGLGAYNGEEGHKGRAALIGAGLGAGLGGGAHYLQGGSLHEPVVAGANTLKRLVDPRTTAEELGKSMHAMSNESPRALDEMYEKLHALPNADIDKLVGRTLGGSIVGGVGGYALADDEHKGKGALMGAGLGAGVGMMAGGPIRALQEQMRGGNIPLSELGYRSTNEDAGFMNSLRKGGWMGNRPLYDPEAAGVPSVPWRSALNKATRAVPGEKALNVGMAGFGAYQDAKEKDHEGRHRGKGERILGAGLGALTNLGTMHHGFVPSMVAGLSGSFGGKALGRGIDHITGDTDEAERK